MSSPLAKNLRTRQVVRQASLPLLDLRTRLAPDHGLEVPDDQWIGVRPDYGTDDVVRGPHIRTPVADRLAGCVLQGARPRGDGRHSGAQQLHAVNIQGLAMVAEPPTTGRAIDGGAPLSGLVSLTGCWTSISPAAAC